MTNGNQEYEQTESGSGADWRLAAQDLYLEAVERLLQRGLSASERELAIHAHVECEAPATAAARIAAAASMQNF